MAQPYWINQHRKKPAEKKNNGSYLVLLLLMFLWSLIIVWVIIKTLVTVFGLNLVRFLQLYNYIETKMENIEKCLMKKR